MPFEVLSADPRGSARLHTLLFVHGAWHGAWCWAEHFLPYFTAEGYRCLAVSLRGHGASPGGKLRWTSIADYVDDVRSLVDSLDAEPILVGHSMGGLVVQRYLEGRDAPAAVLLASAPVNGVLAATLRVARRHPLRFLRVNLTMSLWPLVDSPDLAREQFFSASLPSADVARYHGMLQDESYRAYIDMLVRRPRPNRVKTPLLVIGGAADGLFSPDEVEATARAYGTEAVIVDELAHDAMLDTNWKAAAEALRDGLDDLLGA